MDGDDDWLISSLERYDQLFMYDLSTPVHLMHLASDKGLWVYGQTVANKRELSLLTLPTKVTDKEITGGRDFKIAAGAVIPFSINCFQELSNQQVVLCNADTHSLHWWKEDERSPDLLVEASSVNIPIPYREEMSTGISYIDYWRGSNSDELLLGSAQSNSHVLIYDTNSNTVSWEAALKGTRLHGAHYYGTPYQVALCTGESGGITIADVREPSPFTHETHPSPQPSVDTHRYKLSCSSSVIGTLSNTGLLRLYDTRSFEEPFYSFSVSTMCDSSSSSSSSEHAVLSLSPENERLIGISGLNLGITIYDTLPTLPKTIFTHDGHEKEGAETVKVHAHVWHPRIARLLISAGSDGGLHMWQYTVQ